MLDIQILNLGSEENTLPAAAPQSSRSPKRSRASLSLYDPQWRVEDADEEDDGDFDGPLPKKQRCAPRQNSNFEARDAALRASKLEF
jgi:hypothetical protein